MSQSAVLIENVIVTGSGAGTYNIPFTADTASGRLLPGNLYPTGGTANCANVQVQTYDALRGQTGPIAGATVTLAGLVTGTTNANGIATLAGVPAGPVSVKVTASNYVSVTQVVTISCTGSNTLVMAISPVGGVTGGLSSGQFRAVLTWGANPSDLDAHMTGPNAGSDGRWHVYYGAISAGDMCALDVDDTSSYGPETITCPRTNTTGTSLRAGLYRYSVNHYSGSGTIGTSGANVRLEFADGSVYNFTPPSSGYTGYGDVWTVFELTVNANGTISVAAINRVSSSSGAVYGRSPDRTLPGDPGDDSGIVRTAPAKAR